MRINMSAAVSFKSTSNSTFADQHVRCWFLWKYIQFYLCGSTCPLLCPLKVHRILLMRINNSAAGSSESTSNSTYTDQHVRCCVLWKYIQFYLYGSTWPLLMCPLKVHPILLMRISMSAAVLTLWMYIQFYLYGSTCPLMCPLKVHPILLMRINMSAAGFFESTSNSTYADQHVRCCVNPLKVHPIYLYGSTCPLLCPLKVHPILLMRINMSAAVSFESTSNSTYADQHVSCCVLWKYIQFFLCGSTCQLLCPLKVHPILLMRINMSAAVSLKYIQFY